MNAPATADPRSIQSATTAIRRALDRKPDTWRLSTCLRVIDDATYVLGATDLAHPDRRMADLALTDAMHQALFLANRGRELIATNRRKLQDFQLDLAKRDGARDSLALQRATEERLQFWALIEDAAGLAGD